MVVMLGYSSRKRPNLISRTLSSAILMYLPAIGYLPKEIVSVMFTHCYNLRYRVAQLERIVFGPVRAALAIIIVAVN